MWPPSRQECFFERSPRMALAIWIQLISSYTNFQVSLLSTLSLSFIYFFLFFFLIIITFLICSEFCHTLKWNVLEFTCLPHPDPPSHLPLHPLPPGLTPSSKQLRLLNHVYPEAEEVWARGKVKESNIWVPMVPWNQFFQECKITFIPESSWESKLYQFCQERSS